MIEHMFIKIKLETYRHTLRYNVHITVFTHVLDAPIYTTHPTSRDLKIKKKIILKKGASYT